MVNLKMVREKGVVRYLKMYLYKRFPDKSVNVFGVLIQTTFKEVALA